MASRIRVVVCLTLLALMPSATQLHARPARPAPALPAPTGAIVNVSTEPQLQAAVRGLASNTTIVIAPGTYVLTSTLYVRGVTNVAIRGATANSDDVVLVGPGMAQPNYGSVPFGIWTGLGVNGITIANLTIRDLFFHPIIFNDETENPRVYNVHLIDAGEQFIKVNPDGLGGGIDNGILEYSVIEFTTTAKNDYSKGIDIQTARNWVIRHNLFRNLMAPAGQLAGPAILAWRGTVNTVVEGNAFINCGRGVMLGSDDYYSPSHRGGVIRNNTFYRAQPGDVGIILSDSPDTQILNNTVFLSGTYRAPIEYRYPGTTNVLIANNLLDGAIQSRDGGTATLAGNSQAATAAMFVNAATGDLHLSAQAATAIDRGTPLANVTDDWDGQARPQGAGYDIGADERGATAAAYRIGGRVTDAGGAGLAGVTLTLSGGQSLTTTSDGTGAYQFPALAAGAAYTVTPARAGYSFSPGTQHYAALAQDQPGADFVASALGSGGAAAAVYVGTDTTTRGSWIGSYGGDGYAVAGAASSFPSYAQVSVASAPTWTWAPATADARALQRPGGSGRLAACWYSASSLTIDVNLTDGQAHRLALHALDWDGLGRSADVEVVDAATGAVLDTRALSGFLNGQYVVWRLSGHVRIRVTNSGVQNAVVSGLFFDGAGSTPPPPPPPAGGAATATFTGTDDTTGGSWKGIYGAQGYGIVGATSSYPSYAQVAVTSASSWTWSSSTADPRAVQRAAGTDRVAATWYAATAFTIDVNLTDGQPHRVALYSLDWDRLNRTFKVDVVDAASGALLDSRTQSVFQNGRWLIWTLSGHVLLRLTNTGPQNVVAAGLFFDAATGAPPPSTAGTAALTATDDLTRGNWIGAYGTAGYALAGLGTALPAWAQLSVVSASSYTWTTSTNDGRALLRPGGGSRFVSCWYSSGSFTIDLNVTDGASHRVALHALDWDPWGRAQRIEVLDASTGTVLDSRELTAFQGGRYLVWTISGHVTFRVTNNGNPNAVVSGVFLQ